jgi:hypothetical protein
MLVWEHTLQQNYFSGLKFGVYESFTLNNRILILKAVSLHTMEALGGEEV